ncbi:hypothetical protein ACEXQE_15670 [Herbiconiux sp. P17]|uniref:SLAC1 family transporter n=1 Tax=Herbiconiux wuyangfengii TaxID=3342794 RepID=UPI0035BB93B6
MHTGTAGKSTRRLSTGPTCSRPWRPPSSRRSPPRAWTCRASPSARSGWGCSSGSSSAPFCSRAWRSSPPLPDALTPTLAITIAPPAIGGTAWFAMNGVHADAVSTAFLGVLIVTLLFQLFMIGTYLRLPFSLGHWSFTFPVASAASYGIQWMRLTAFPGWQFVALAAAAVSTALTLTIAVRSLLLVTRVRRGIRRAEQTLRRADDAVARRMPLSKPSAPTHSQGSPS